ncbi:MAG: hypothetical protein NDJ24_10150 [Alphaproteobacteria bacterium]|nr:hypothetical protein [Alphaproteobacteria bacterium]
MLSTNFRELLDIQEERLVAIRAECAPFTSGQDAAAAALHQRIVDDIDQVLQLTRDFRAATPQTTEEKRTALGRYGAVSKISMELCSLLFSNSRDAGPFRHPALQKHAVLIHTIAREQVLTCVNTGWAVIEDMLAESKTLSQTFTPQTLTPLGEPDANLQVAPATTDTPTRGHLRIVANDGVLVDRRPQPRP